MAFRLDDMNAVMKEKFFPTAVDIVFKRIILFYRLLAKNHIKLDGPGQDDKITQVVVAKKYPIESHDNRYGRLKVPVEDVLTKASISLATRYGSLSLTRQDELRTTTDEAVLDLLDTRFNILVTSLIEEIEEQLFIQKTVSIGNEIDSLQKIIDNGDTYPEYAALSRVDLPDWKAYVRNLNNQTLTYEDLSNTFKKLERGKDAPTLVITTSDLWTKIGSLIFDKQIFPPPKEDPSLGVDNFKVFGAPCISSPYVPAGTIYFLNENYLQLILLKSADRLGMTLLGFERLELSTIKALHLLMDVQLFCLSPARQGKIINAGV